MKKTIAFILFLLIGYLCMAQVTIQPFLPQTGLFQKSQLWNVLVVNSSSEDLFDCYLVLSLQDRESGAEILSATSGYFSLGKEAKQLNTAVLTPVQYTYFSFTGDKTNDFLPVGNYTACFKLIGGKAGTELAEACVPIDVEPLSPPMLISPVDSSVLKASPTQFTWQPPAPFTMFQQLHYEVVIAEILPGQKPDEAIQLNAPFYMDLNVPGSFISYNGAYPSFEKGKWYAWQVVAQDGENYAAKTPVWDFTVDTLAFENSIVEQTPFVKMKEDEIEKGIAPNGILKLSYVNETTDSIATIRVIDIGSKNEHQFKMPVKRGENLIQYDLKKIMTIQEGKVYEAQIINSRNEKWVLQFQVYNYNK